MVRAEPAKSDSRAVDATLRLLPEGARTFPKVERSAYTSMTRLCGFEQANYCDISNTKLISRAKLNRTLVFSPDSAMASSVIKKKIVVCGGNGFLGR